MVPSSDAAAGYDDPSTTFLGGDLDGATTRSSDGTAHTLSHCPSLARALRRGQRHADCQRSRPREEPRDLDQPAPAAHPGRWRRGELRRPHGDPWAGPGSDDLVNVLHHPPTYRPGVRRQQTATLPPGSEHGVPGTGALALRRRRVRDAAVLG